MVKTACLTSTSTALPCRFRRSSPPSARWRSPGRCPMGRWTWPPRPRLSPGGPGSPGRSRSPWEGPRSTGNGPWHAPPERDQESTNWFCGCWLKVPILWMFLERQTIERKIETLYMNGIGCLQYVITIKTMDSGSWSLQDGAHAFLFSAFHDVPSKTHLKDVVIRTQMIGLTPFRQRPTQSLVLVVQLHLTSDSCHQNGCTTQKEICFFSGKKPDL